VALLRRTPLVQTLIDVDASGNVAVTFAPAPGRWPDREAVDRLVLPAGIAAIALSRASEAAFDIVHGQVRRAATAVATIATDDPAERVREATGLRLVPSIDVPDPRITVQLVRSRLGPVPTVGRAGHASTLLAAAAGAAAGVCTAAAPAGLRLAAALLLEGLLGWYRAADPHLQPPQQAVAFALRHADARLAERGHPSPDALAAAVVEQRKIEPMAGG
jgi:hypothetical protein